MAHRAIAIVPPAAAQTGAAPRPMQSPFLGLHAQFAQIRGEVMLHPHLAAGIPTEIDYPSPLHLERAYTYLGHKAGDFPVAEEASREVLALPIFAELTEPQQRAVVGRIASFFSSRN